jgi:hypothetical protein
MNMKQEEKLHSMLTHKLWSAAVYEESGFVIADLLGAMLSCLTMQGPAD